MKPARFSARIAGSSALLLALATSSLLAPGARAAIDSGAAAIAGQVPGGVSPATLSEPVFLDVVKRASAAQPGQAPQIAAAAAKISVGNPSPVAPTAEGLAAIAIAAIDGATPESESPDPMLIDAVIKAVADAVSGARPIAAPAATPGDGKQVADGKRIIDHKELTDFKGVRDLPADVIAAMTEIVLNHYPLRPARLSLRSVPLYNYTAPPNARPAPTPAPPVQEEEERPPTRPRPRPTPVVPPKEEVTPFRPSSR
jgi:hypothetical protein